MQTPSLTLEVSQYGSVELLGSQRQLAFAPPQIFAPLSEEHSGVVGGFGGVGCNTEKKEETLYQLWADKT